jgi:ADP-ribose pyrophosphatase
MGAPQDTRVDRTVLDSRVVHRGMIWDVVRETVELGDSGTVTREFVRHPGAVAVVALNDDDDILLLRQYRHPAGAELWEPPAGLRDVPGEDPLRAAQRELMEEADMVAESWWVLVDYLSSPGGSDETLRCMPGTRAHWPCRTRSATPGRPRSGTSSPGGPPGCRVDGVLAGRLRNPSTVAGVLAAGEPHPRGRGCGRLDGACRASTWRGPAAVGPGPVVRLGVPAAR